MSWREQRGAVRQPRQPVGGRVVAVECDEDFDRTRTQALQAVVQRDTAAQTGDRFTEQSAGEDHERGVALQRQLDERLPGARCGVAQRIAQRTDGAGMPRTGASRSRSDACTKRYVARRGTAPFPCMPCPSSPVYQAGSTKDPLRTNELKLRVGALYGVVRIQGAKRNALADDVTGDQLQ